MNHKMGMISSVAASSNFIMHSKCTLSSLSDGKDEEKSWIGASYSSVVNPIIGEDRVRGIQITRGKAFMTSTLDGGRKGSPKKQTRETRSVDL